MISFFSPTAIRLEHPDQAPSRLEEFRPASARAGYPRPILPPRPSAPAPTEVPVSLLNELRSLLARRRYTIGEVSAADGPVLLLDTDDPEGGAGLVADGPPGVVELWQGGDLLCLAAPEIGTLRFQTAAECDRFLYDLSCRGWSQLHVDDYRIVP